MSLEISRFSITELIEECIKRNQKMIEKNNYKLSFEKNENVYVQADEVKILQVVYNLLTNAINYTGENKNVIVRQIVKDNIVRIEFQDFGEGIPKEQFPNIWDRYYKLDKNHKRSNVGSGLGLSIVRNILELHKAKYGLRSAVGIGSVFWFELNVN